MVAYRHPRLLLRALFLLGSCACLAEDTNNPQASPTYRSRVSEVRVTFFVTKAGNERVETVTPSDFAIVDNGIVIRNFRSFRRSDETAVDLFALLDVSESVAPRLRGAMNGVLQLVSAERSRPDDNVSVLSFGGLRPAVLCSGGCRDSGEANKLLSVTGGGLTPLFDGMVFAAEFIVHHQRAGARPVLLLFSDGRDTISLNSARDAMESVIASGAVIYAIDIGAPRNQSEGTSFLRRVSESTGGRYLSAGDGVATVLKTVLDDLRASYVVSYGPPSRQAGVHSLRLLPTRNLNLRFHSRANYYYEKDIR